MKLEIKPDRREVTLHVSPESIASLRAALDDAEAGEKVFLGDLSTGLLIIRPEGYGQPIEPVTTAPEQAVDAWAVMEAAEFAPSSDEIALLATLEAMRVLLTSSEHKQRRSGRDGIHALLGLFTALLREHEPGELDRLTAHWAEQAKSMGLEW